MLRFSPGPDCQPWLDLPNDGYRWAYSYAVYIAGYNPCNDHASARRTPTATEPCDEEMWLPWARYEPCGVVASEETLPPSPPPPNTGLVILDAGCGREVLGLQGHDAVAAGAGTELPRALYTRPETWSASLPIDYANFVAVRACNAVPLTKGTGVPTDTNVVIDTTALALEGANYLVLVDAEPATVYWLYQYELETDAASTDAVDDLADGWLLVNADGTFSELGCASPPSPTTPTPLPPAADGEPCDNPAGALPCNIVDCDVAHFLPCDRVPRR